MSKEQTNDLLKFLAPFPKEIQDTALWLRAFVWDIYPKSNELIYDSYNAVAFGWSPTDRLGQVFCGVAVMRSNNNIHFNFFNGAELTDLKNILLGNGVQYRYILVTDKKSFPRAYMKSVIKEAYLNSKKKIKNAKDVKEGLTIVKAIYAKKRKPKKKA